jgi:signal transduction histidine kinase
MHGVLVCEATTEFVLQTLVVPPRHTVTEFGSSEGWGSGPFVYLRFQVQDTGCGLSPQQISLLFEKFAQAVGQCTKWITD